PQGFVVTDARLRQRVDTAVRSTIAPSQPTAYGLKRPADKGGGIQWSHREQHPRRGHGGGGRTPSPARPGADARDGPPGPEDGPVGHEDVAGMEVPVQDARSSDGRRAMRLEPRKARQQSFQPTLLRPCLQSREYIFCSGKG